VTLLHPLAVHFPIALWLTSFLFDLLARGRGSAFHARAASWLIAFGMLGAAASIGTGWLDLLGQEREGVGPGLLLRHRNHAVLAYAATACYLVSLGRRWYTDHRPDGWYVALASLGAVLIAAAGYLGGELRSVM
jgi:uncharacterized membrane protein